MNDVIIFFKIYPEHSHVMLEAWLTSSQHLASAIATEKKVFEDFNRQVAEKLIADSKLRADVTSEQALVYISFIQELFRNYYLNLSHASDLSVKLSDYENRLKEVLDLMVYGILEKKE